MSISLGITAYSSQDNEQFQKHFKAVKFCIENELSFPKETSLFFEGKVGGENLENVLSAYILKHIENGVEVPIANAYENYEYRILIRVKDIPDSVDTIVVELS